MTNGSTVVRVGRPPARRRRHLRERDGVPIEVMINLANTLHGDPWFCIPHQATDDYVRQFAALLRARLDPTLRPHIEYSNEVWNTSFAQTQWAIAESQRLGLRDAVRHAVAVLRPALGRDLQDHAAGLGRRQRPPGPRDRRPGGVDAVPRGRAGLEGHRGQCRRARDRAVLHRRGRRRRRQRRRDAEAVERPDRRPDARDHPRQREGVDARECDAGGEIRAQAEGLRERPVEQHAGTSRPTRSTR